MDPEKYNEDIATSVNVIDKAIENIRSELDRIGRMTFVIDSLRYKLAREGFDDKMNREESK